MDKSIRGKKHVCHNTVNKYMNNQIHNYMNKINEQTQITQNTRHKWNTQQNNT